MSYKSELIRKLFSDRLKKDELKDLSEIDMIEQKWYKRFSSNSGKQDI